MTTTTLTRDDITTEITAAIAHGETNIHRIHDRLCGRSRTDSAYFGRVLAEMERDGLVYTIRPGFVAAGQTAITASQIRGQRPPSLGVTYRGIARAMATQWLE